MHYVNDMLLLYVICYVLCFYVSLLFILMYAPLVCRVFHAVKLILLSSLSV
jgi:hypothetical protein